MLRLNEMTLTVPVNQNSPDHRQQVKDLHKRRRWVRCPAELAVDFVPVSGTLPVCSAMIRDMSCGGVRLVSMVKLESGATIRMRLKSVREARVVYVLRETTGQWSVGCAFREELPPADVQQLVISH